MPLWQIKDLNTGSWEDRQFAIAGDAAKAAHEMIDYAITHDQDRHLVVMGESEIIAEYISRAATWKIRTRVSPRSD